MKKSVLLTIGLMVVFCLSASCNKNKSQDPSPVTSGTEVASGTESAATDEILGDYDIATEIYELIPKEDLPDFCRQMSRNAEVDSIYGVPYNPRAFSDSKQGYEIDMDPGLYASFVIHCYPLKTGGWRAYWVSYAGMDGLCGFYGSDAYNYVDGELTRETEWVLPCPPASELIDLEALDIDEDELDRIQESPNYSYAFYNDLLEVTIDLDYLNYPMEEGEEGYIKLPESATVSYAWDGLRFVRVDEDGNPVE